MRGKRIWFWMALYFLNCSNASPTSFQTLKPDDIRWEVSAAVHSILLESHRGGSLIYRGECQENTRMRDRYLVAAPLHGEALNEALDRITQLHPNLAWVDFGPEAVRILDRSANAKLLNLHVNEFQLAEATTASMAVGHDIGTKRRDSLSSVRTRMHAKLVWFSCSARIF